MSALGSYRERRSERRDRRGGGATDRAREAEGGKPGGAAPYPAGAIPRIEEGAGEGVDRPWERRHTPSPPAASSGASPPAAAAAAATADGPASRAPDEAGHTPECERDGRPTRSHRIPSAEALAPEALEALPAALAAARPRTPTALPLAPRAPSPAASPSVELRVSQGQGELGVGPEKIEAPPQSPTSYAA